MSELAKHSPGGRIYFMDEVRGFDLLLMIAYHGFYTVGWLFGVEAGRALFSFFSPVEPFFAGLFIFICGISCRLSRSNLKRGLLLLGVSVLLSAFLWIFMREEMIWFGILHFLSTAILLFALCRPLLDKVPPIAGIVVCAVFLLLTWWLPADRGAMFGIKGLFSLPVPEAVQAQAWLYPLGLGAGAGADYFPFFPWIFCFLAGSFVGVWAKAGRFPQWMYKSRAPWLAWLGRHTLLIYVVHQPVLYGICWIVTLIAGGFG